MTTRPRLKRLAIWTAIAIPLPAALYLGAYYRMLTTITVVQFFMPPMVQRQPRYNLPWPIPSQYNVAELQPALQRAFTPAHRIDQWLRPDAWASQDVHLQVEMNGSGTGDLIMIDTSTNPF